MGSACWRVVIWAALLVACDDARPSPRIESVTPDRAYTDRAVRIAIGGQDFVPTFRIDPATGTRVGETDGFSGEVRNARAAAMLRDFGWLDVTRLTATIDQALPRGTYDVVVEDPRGRRVTLPLGFTALGPDVDPPTVGIAHPVDTTPAAGGMMVPVRLMASDPDPGRLRQLWWSARVVDGAEIAAGECPVASGRPAQDCTVDLNLPPSLPEGTVVRIAASARDDAPRPNTAESVVEVTLRGRPTIAAISPARGGMAGGTDVVITGSGFLPGSRAFVGELPLIPDGGIVVDDRTIAGRVPPASPGARSVRVRTPIGSPELAAVFLYLPPPQIQAISPETGDPEGATRVRIRGQSFTAQTQIYFGADLIASVPLASPMFVDASEIQGLAPGGRGRTTVWAFDPELGWTRLADGFVWMR